jgi:hypothetical protein
MRLVDSFLARFAWYRSRHDYPLMQHRRRRPHLLAGLRCLIKRHTAIPVREGHEIYLRCDACGWESSGWRVGD